MQMAMKSRPRVSKVELEAVVRLNAEARFSYFVKRVVDWEAAWGIWDDGWALVSDSEGVTAFPIWPTKDFAELCLTGGWAEYSVREIDLDHLVGEAIPELAQERMNFAVFPTAQNRGVVVKPMYLRDRLRDELAKWYDE